MGKCISKHPSILTIALSEKDLTTANQIWSKFAESTEYIALKDEHGNQLCEYYYVRDKRRKEKNQNEAMPKTKSSSIQMLQSTDEDNDAQKTIVTRMFIGAKQSSKLYQNSNDNQRPNKNHKQNKKKKNERKTKYLKAIQKQSSTLEESNENKSNQFNHNTNTNRNGMQVSTTTTTTTSTIIDNTESYVQKLPKTEVTNVDAIQTTTTTEATTTTTAIPIKYPYANVDLVSSCEYCTFVSNINDNEGNRNDSPIGNGDDDTNNNDNTNNVNNNNGDENFDDDNYAKEQLFALQSHNNNNLSERIFFVGNVDNISTTTTTTKTTTFDVHKSQQHCLPDLPLQPNIHNDGDIIDADANNNAKNITKKHQEQQRWQQHQLQYEEYYSVQKVEGEEVGEEEEQQKLAKDLTKILLINADQDKVEVCKVNIDVKNSAKVDDESNGVGSDEGQSASNYLTVLSGNVIEGQAESKKHFKKHGGNTIATNGTQIGVGVETKGTAMSFGFRKKLNTTPKKLKKLLEASVGGVTGGGGDMKKKQDKCNNITNITTTTTIMGEYNDKMGTVINVDDSEEISYEQQQQQQEQKDDNGNSEMFPKTHFEKMGSAAITAQRLNQATTSSTGGNQATNLPGVASRFGYRGANIIRPASAGAGLTQQRTQIDMQNCMESNNNNGTNNSINNNRNGVGAVSGQQKPLVSNLKRRSKSAHAGRALTSGDDANDSVSGTDVAGRPKISQPKSITFNLSQNSTIEYQRRQFFEQPPSTYGSYGSGRSSWTTHQQPLMHQTQSVAHQSRNVINTGMHTNVIVRPTPRAPPATFSKFTLHTVSLPKPEFPVAISVGAGTPTTPGNIIYTPSPTMSTTTTTTTPATAAVGARAKDIQSQHPLTLVTSSTLTHNIGGHGLADLKTAKQMANNTRRGFSGSREISADSGIASMDMALDSSISSSGCATASISGGRRTSSPKRSRSRPRNLQMVMNGRHKFEVRDLDDPLSSESSSIVEPLALPKLPSENQTVPLPLCGLVRSNTVLSRESYERNSGVVGNRSAPSTNQENKEFDEGKPRPTTAPAQCTIARNSSEESESVDEEKLYLDRSTSEKGNRFKDINTCSSKTSSPGSSIMLSWCNAGESLAVKDYSSLSVSSEDSNKLNEADDKDKDSDTEKDEKKAKQNSIDLNNDDLSGIITDMQVSTLSSLTETFPNIPNLPEENARATHERTNTTNLNLLEVSSDADKPDRPKTLYNTLNETKFTEMALAGSTYLLDDETSPTDSLVSSTESEEAGSKQKKHKINEELQEKDIDEISPELEMVSPISPGTPTHASRSLSLSECGNLIDDEIADQPALLFNSEAHDLVDSLASNKDKTDTPTLMENTGSLRSLKSLSKARTALQQAIELSLRTPLSLRKAVMDRADSLDTLSPCESICSEDMMMDFDMNSSVDSIDRSSSIKSRSGSDLHKIGETELFSDLERKGSDVMKELNSILRMRTNKNVEKDSVLAHLPARATRLLNRSRLQQQQQYPSTNANGLPANNGAGTSNGSGSGGGGVSAGGADSDSSKSTHSFRRSANASRASNASTTSKNASIPPKNNFSSQQKPFHHYSQLLRDAHTSSSDDLMLNDNSFRNAMIQDVLQFKKQLLRLRRILKEDEDELMRTETLNPLDNDNGQLFAACGLDSKLLDDTDLVSLTSSNMDDPMMELADLRRQVVYLQGEVEDRERTIRLQQNQIENLESKKPTPPIKNDNLKECINIATQTERRRPFSYGPEGLSRSKPEYTSYTTHYHPASSCDNKCICQSANSSCNNNICTQQHMQCHCNKNNNNNNNSNFTSCATDAAMCQQQQVRRHTIISTTLSNYDRQLALAPRRASIAWEKPTATAITTTSTPTLSGYGSTSAIGTKTHAPTTNIYKPVKITLIGEPLKQWQWNAVGNSKITTTTTQTATNGNSNIIQSNNNDNKMGECERSKSNSNGISNVHTNGISKKIINNSGFCNGSNGYANGNSCNNTKSIDCDGDDYKQNCYNNLKMNGQQKSNQNHFLNNQQEAAQQQQQQQYLQTPAQTQTLTNCQTHRQATTSKNAFQHKNYYQQQQLQQQQQQKQNPLKFYEKIPNNNTNGNFNPTVTIV